MLAHDRTASIPERCFRSIVIFYFDVLSGVTQIITEPWAATLRLGKWTANLIIRYAVSFEYIGHFFELRRNAFFLRNWWFGFWTCWTKFDFIIFRWWFLLVGVCSIPNYWVLFTKSQEELVITWNFRLLLVLNYYLFWEILLKRTVISWFQYGSRPDIFHLSW